MDEFDEFSLITKLDQQTLIHLLVSIPGTKEMVVEANLLRPLDKICSMSLLRDQNCMRVQQLHFDRTIVWDDDIEHRIFFIRPTIGVAAKICELIRSDSSRHYSIIQVQVDNGRNFLMRELERSGLYGMVDLYEFNLTLIPLESDLFSMELPQYSPDTFDRYFGPMARALWQLQTLYGQIQTTFGIGECFSGVYKRFKRNCLEMGEPNASADQPISHLFIFDRRLDLASVFLTGLTYESVLNDIFAYNCGKIAFGSSVDQKLQQRNASLALSKQPTSRIYALNNLDPIFSSIRNSHMTAVFPFLSAKAKFLQLSMDRISSIHKIDEMKSFVSNELGSLKEQQRQLEMHICACEELLEKMRGSNERFGYEHAIIRSHFEHSEVLVFVLKLISSKYDPWSVLQLAALWSIRGNGIPAKCYRQFQEAFLHRYGFEQHMSTLYGLRKHGILNEEAAINLIPLQAALKATKKLGEYKKDSKPVRKNHHDMNGGSANEQQRLSEIIDAFQLCPPETPRGEKSKVVDRRQSVSTATSSEAEEKNEQNLGFPFSDAYIPLISRLIERTVIKGWDEQYLKKILGNQSVFCTNPNPKPPDNRIRRALLVCFVGGVTYAEIASLRCFTQKYDFRLLMLTTHVIHREKFIKSYSNFL